MYGVLGLYEEGNILLERALEMFTKHFGSDHGHTDWSLVLFGKFCVSIGQYERAKKFLEKTLYGHIKQFGTKHYRISWIMHSLGLAYARLGFYQQAEKCFIQSLSCYEKKYGKYHVEYALVLRDFAEYLILIGEFEKSKMCLRNIFNILKNTNHPEIYKCFELFGELYLQKGKQSNMELHKKIAYLYLQKALIIAEKYFPQNSVHIARLKAKIPLKIRCLLFIKSFLAGFVARNSEL